MANSSADPATVEDQTLRLIVHTSVGGSSLRLRLSNTHGDRAMKIAAASVALHAEGASIRPGSSQSLRFGSQAEVIIPRGATVISDPIAFMVPELTNLAVSLYLPENSGFLTAHALANQTNYVSESGNHVANVNLPIEAETTAWNILTAIDVINNDSVSAIAMVGDSITDGWGSTDSGNQRWPNHFARRLFADSSTGKYAVLNAGISGNQVTTEGNSLFGQNLQARFERDVLALTGVTHMVLMEGINDIGMPSMAGGAPAGELVRQEVNEFIRNGGTFDGVIDFDRAIQDPANPSRILPALTEDNLHPNDIGYKLMADSIDLSLFR